MTKDAYIIKKGQIYLPSYFRNWEQRIDTPANSLSPHAHFKYDYKILGTLYNVYAKEIIDGFARYQKVTSIWDRTSDRQVEKLEVIVGK